MIQIFDTTKIYVHCPAGMVTGGAELLHQLVSSLNNNGHNAYIVYYGENTHNVPEDYRCYNIKTSVSVEDINENIEVIFEGRYDLAFNTNNTQKVLWWLSVDNYWKNFIANNINPLDLLRFSKKLAVKAAIYQLKSISKGMYKHLISIKKLKSLNALHAYQSEYAQNFLQNNGFRELLPLKDFINIEHLSTYDTKNKKDIVLYNPKKGLSFTKKLIERTPDIKWIPLQGMSRNELIHVIKEAKLYVDFGHHPGKDRLPRECAMNGCCIITGERGSAAFFEDVMIQPKYKFNEKKTDIDSIIKTIRWILNNYNTTVDDFKMYRESISEERDEFEQQVIKIFGEKRGLKAN